MSKPLTIALIAASVAVIIAIYLSGERRIRARELRYRVLVLDGARAARNLPPGEPPASTPPPPATPSPAVIGDVNSMGLLA